MARVLGVGTGGGSALLRVSVYVLQAQLHQPHVTLPAHGAALPGRCPPSPCRSRENAPGIMPQRTRPPRSNAARLPTWRPRTRMDTRPRPPAPRAVRPTRRTYSEGSLGKSNSTTCSTNAESTPREARSVHTSTSRRRACCCCCCAPAGPPLSGAARNACSVHWQSPASALCCQAQVRYSPAGTGPARRVSPPTPSLRPHAHASAPPPPPPLSFPPRPGRAHLQVGCPLVICDGGVVGQHPRTLLPRQVAVEEVLHLGRGAAGFQWICVARSTPRHNLSPVRRRCLGGVSCKA